MSGRATTHEKIAQWAVAGLLVLFIAAIPADAEQKKKSVRPISWNRCLSMKPEFYASDEAIRIADNVLLYQRNTGGWPKGVDMARILSDNDKAKLHERKNKKDSTLDNGATHTQMRYLAKVYTATKLKRFKKGFLEAVDYLLKAQYANGGWPQFYPLQGNAGYSRYITFNDNAMIGAMSVLRDIAEKRPEYVFIDDDRHKKAEKAVQKGIQCILECQIIVDGKRTAWCQQHDEKTLEPRSARTYEKISICSGESVGIVRFLMSIDNPKPEIIDAVQAAVAWLDHVKLSGIRQIRKPDESKEGGYDKVVIEDATTPPIWARFYQIRTNRPIFCGRDGIIKYSLAEIEHERRIHYSWYGSGPASLLAKDYPAWQKNWAPNRNVLKN